MAWGLCDTGKSLLSVWAITQYSTEKEKKKKKKTHIHKFPKGTIFPTRFYFRHVPKIYSHLKNPVFAFSICDLWEFMQFLLSALFSVGGMDVC